MIKFESEKHLENFFVQHFDSTGECIIDDQKFDDLKQQLNIGSYGIPDLVYFAFDEGCKTNRLHIVELKNTKPKLEDVAQIARYRTYFTRALRKYANVDIECSLVFPDEESLSEVVWLFDHMQGVNFITFRLNPKEGIVFDQSYGWHKKDEDLEIARNLLIEPLEFDFDESPF